MFGDFLHGVLVFLHFLQVEALKDSVLDYLSRHVYIVNNLGR